MIQICGLQGERRELCGVALIKLRKGDIFMTSIKVFSKKAVSVILSLLMILTVVPAMSLTAYAADVWVMGGSQTISSDQTCTTFTVYDSATLTVNQGVAPPYADLKNTTTVVTFDGKEWYLIDYDSSTVTLLAKECVAASQYNSSGSYVEYASSTVKTAVDNWYNNNITSNAKTAVFDNKMFLLTKDQANAMTTDTRKCSQASEANYNYWWLCSPGSFGNFASCVYGGNGNVLAYGYSVVYALGVRPALKLDLSKVEFDSATNTFAVASSHEHDFTYSVNGDTITATCTATGCDLTDDNEVTLTIVAPTLTIVGQTGDGISEYATLTGLEAFNEATGLNVAETDIKYYAVETYEIDGNTYKRQGNELDGAPTDAGEYIAGLTLSDVKISETATRDVTARTWYTITEPAPTYTVTWMNGDDILETDTDLEPGALPSYDGETPTKDEDDDFTYDFIGWTSGPNFYTPDELPIVDGDTTYVATFESTPKHEAGYYVIGTMTEWKIDDNYLLTANTEAEGDEYMLNGVALTSNDAIKVVKYEPGNWTWYPDGTGNDYEITADGTYDIYFRPNCDGGEEWYENCIKAVNVTEFTITWKNDDGSVIDTTTVVYGDTPTHADATKAPDKYYTYTFVGWTPEITAVTGDAEYTATFDSTVNEYTITWKNDDGSVIDTTTVAYGETPTHADATKDATDQYTYTFAGWTPEIVAVTGDTEYTATFDSTVNEYTITWKNDDSSVIDTTTVAYGETPTHADAAKDATEQYTYTFAGWTPEVVAVTGDAEYTATFSSAVNEYTITWKNDDGTVIDTTTVAYGDTPTHADATKEATEQYTYTFTGWTPEVVAVTGDAEYTATFEAVKKTLIGDADGDGQVTIVDATWIQRYLASFTLDFFDEAAADVDGDGDVSIIDATWIQRYLAEMPVKFPIDQYV